MLKKDRNKERAGHQRREPTSKRQKMEDGSPMEPGAEKKSWKIPEMEKRKTEEPENEIQERKKLKKDDIRNFLIEAKADIETDTNLAQGNLLVPDLGGGVGPEDQGQIGEAKADQKYSEFSEQMDKEADTSMEMIEEKISEKMNMKKDWNNGKDEAKADQESNLEKWYTGTEADTSLAGGSRLVPGLGGGVGPEDQGQTGVPASQDEVKADQNFSEQTGKKADTCKERKEKIYETDEAKADQEINTRKGGERADQDNCEVGTEADTA